MRKFFQVPAFLALAFGAGSLFAQDGAKKEPTSAEKVVAAIHDQCCSKGAKCEGDQKKVCDQVGATISAGIGRSQEKCKKEGMNCEECAKAKDGGPCKMCADLAVKTWTPWVKKQASAKDASHTLTGTDGKSETVKCSLTAGPVCKGCSEEMSDALVKAVKKAGEKK